LGLSLFISIPLMQQNKSRLLNGRKTKIQLLTAGSPERNGNLETSDSEAEPAIGNPQSGLISAAPLVAGSAATLDRFLHPFSEALRDRLITFFEIKNLTHKPKLVALASCSKGSGVSSIARGLAASLSETGDGNVLLVDMNHEHGATQDFHCGKLACGLDDAL